MDQDLPHVMSIAMPEKKFDKPSRRNSAAAKSATVEQTLARELPIELVKAALEQYRDDYELFGYDMEQDLLFLFGTRDSTSI